MQKNNFHNILKNKSDKFAFLVYNVSKRFPKEEIYGITSQLRRSLLSVILNYIEGYARKGTKEYKYFLKISYSSLKESQYLIFFAHRENYLSKEEYKKLINLADELGAMFWSIIDKIDKK